MANALRERLKRLLGNEPRLAERIDVHSLPALGLRLHKVHVGKAGIVSRGALAAGKVVGDHEATVAFGKNGTIVVVSATVDAAAGTDLEPKVEAVAQQIAGQL